MKIAASDFDGTLQVDREISQGNLAAIHRWQEAGNKFGLVTGRNLHLAKIGLAPYDLKLDFCVALNGAAVYDGEEREIFGACLPKECLRDLWAHELARESPYVITLRGKDSFVKWNDPNWSDPLRRADLKEVTPEEAVEIPGVMQVCFAASSPERAKELAEDLNRSFGKLLIAEVNLFYIDVCARGNNKGTGLVHLQEGMGWQDCPLYVIGDDLNDLSMVERFQGFAMEQGNPQLKEIASRVFPSVEAMLDTMMDAVE